MRFEVIEDAGDWVVRTEGDDVARFPDQDAALQHVAERLRTIDAGQPAALSVRYRQRGD